MDTATKQPEEFTFVAADWPVWKTRFTRFLNVSGLKSKDEEVQIDALVYHMGGQAEDLLSSFALKDAEKKKYATVLAKFDSHFEGKKNVIYERARFNLRTQGEGEAVDDFILDLYRLADRCEYGDKKDEWIRDRLVVGVADRRVSEKLQLIANLDLVTAVTTVRQHESVRRQQADLQGDSSVNRISSRTSGCPTCGGPKRHAAEECPARDADCRKCSRKGHWARVCKGRDSGSSSGKINYIEELQDDQFLG